MITTIPGTASNDLGPLVVMLMMFAVVLGVMFSRFAVFFACVFPASIRLSRRMFSSFAMVMHNGRFGWQDHRRGKEKGSDREA